MKSTERQLYKLKTEILQAIANPIRLAIIDSLKKEAKTVNELVRWLGTSQSNVSKHLALLKHTGIVKDKKVGLRRFYYLALPCVTGFCICANQALKEKVVRQKKLIGKV